MLETNPAGELQEFVYSVSHDFRRPIRHIKSITELLNEKLEPVLDDDTREWLDYLTQASDEALLMLERLLGYSRLCSDERSVANLDLNTLCETAVSENADLIQASAVTVTVDAAGSASTDGGRLATALNELLSNALCYGEGSPVSITAIANDRHAQISVCDQGPGISEEHLAAALRPFGRLVAQDPQHVGLGLNYVTRIAAQLGGSIELTPANPGLQAILSLPAHPAPRR